MASPFKGSHIVDNLGDGFTTAQFFGAQDADGDGVFEVADLSGLQGKSASELLKASGLDWEVHQAPLQYKTLDGNVREMPGRYMNYRSDNGDPLGPVGSVYAVESNLPVFDFMSDVVNLMKDEGAGYLGAAELRGGAQVVALAKVLPTLYIGGDKDEGVVPMFLGRTAHDGSGTHYGRLLFVRAVCCNKNVWAVPGIDVEFSIKHTRELDEVRLEQARAVVGDFQTACLEFGTLGDSLLEKKLDTKQADRFLTRLFPAIKGKQKQNTEAENRRDAVKAIYVNGANLQNVTGTAWGMLQAVTEYCDWQNRTKVHGDRSREEVLFERSIEPSPYKDAALKMLQKV